MKNSFPSTCLVFILGVLFSLNGCASTAPTKFYSLTSEATPDITYKADVPDRNFSVGVGPVKVSDYLDRPQIVTRTGRNGIKVSDFNKWAGSLESDIQRVLAENLSTLLVTRHVYSHPWKSYAPLNYRVEVDVTRFEGTADGNVMLRATWKISAGKENTLIMMDSGSFSEQADGTDYGSVVAAKSRALADLSRVIGASINTVRYHDKLVPGP
jgi:uncharacterized lipoprotein YmbA